MNNIFTAACKNYVWQYRHPDTRGHNHLREWGGGEEGRGEGVGRRGGVEGKERWEGERGRGRVGGREEEEREGREGGRGIHWCKLCLRGCLTL